MVARLTMITVPGFEQGDQYRLRRAHRVINENFQRITDQLNRAVAGGDLVADGSITEDMLTTATKTLSGDVTGTIGASGSTTVEDVSILTTRGDMLRRGASSPAERLALGATYSVIGSDGTDLGYLTLQTILDNVLGSTRGSILYRGAAGWTILAPNTAGYVLTDAGAGADPSWAAASGGTPPTDFDLLTNGVDELIFAGGDVVWIT